MLTYLKLGLKLCMIACVAVYARATPSTRENFAPERLGTLPENLPETCSSFKNVEGNLSAAKLILLGDFGSYEDERALTQTSQCIDALSENLGDHEILVDGHPAHQPVDCTKAGFSSKPNRKCKGWDSPKTAQWIPDTLREITRHEVREEMYPKDFHSHHSQAQQLRGIVKSFNDIRNEGMIESIKYPSSRNIHRFLVSERMHVTPVNAYGINDIGGSKNVRRELEEEETPYAVVTV